MIFLTFTYDPPNSHKIIGVTKAIILSKAL